MQSWELVVILGVVVLLFGAARLPKIARSLGEARTELDKVRREATADDDAPVPVETSTAAPTAPVVEVAVPAPAPAAHPLPPPLPPPSA